MTAPDPIQLSGGFVSNEVIDLRLRQLEATLSASVANLVAEMRLLRSDAVRRDVYDEQRRADLAELASVKKDLADTKDDLRGARKEADEARKEAKDEMKEARNRKWAVWVALAAAIFALGKDLLKTGLIG